MANRTSISWFSCGIQPEGNTNLKHHTQLYITITTSLNLKQINRTCLYFCLKSDVIILAAGFGTVCGYVVKKGICTACYLISSFLQISKSATHWQTISQKPILCAGSSKVG